MYFVFVIWNFQSLMFAYLICFLPRTKASVFLGLIRFRSLSCSSFVRKQNEVLYNTEDLIALLFSSLGFNYPFFFSFFLTFLTCLALVLRLWKAVSPCAPRCTRARGYNVRNCPGSCCECLTDCRVGVLSVETELQGRRVWGTTLQSAAQVHYKIVEVRSSALQT